MSDMLTEKIANEIVKETSMRIGRNVNIMNVDGVIIATQDKARIGTFHEGAKEVLKSGETLFIDALQDAEWKGAQPGVNLPIVFQDEIIGVIGITGNPKEMEDIGALVKMTTELMIRQEYMASQLEWRQHTKVMVIEELLKQAPSISRIDRGLGLLDFHLNAPYMIIIIQIKERSLANQVLIERIEEVFGSSQVIAGFIHVNQVFIVSSGLIEETIHKKIEMVYHQLKRLHFIFKIAHSLPFYKMEEFNQAYKECELTLKISDPDQEIISFAQIEAKALINQVDNNIAEKLANRVLKNIDVTNATTLEAFFDNDLNIQKTADHLYIHRNTMIYRLNKLTKTTGYDPKKFKDAITLQIALWIHNK